MKLFKTETGLSPATIHRHMYKGSDLQTERNWTLSGLSATVSYRASPVVRDLNLAQVYHHSVILF